MIADDFAEIMQEIVPKLVEQVFHKPMHPMQLCHHHDLIVSNVRLVQTVLNHMVTLRPHGLESSSSTGDVARPTGVMFIQHVCRGSQERLSMIVLS